MFFDDYMFDRLSFEAMMDHIAECEGYEERMNVITKNEEIIAEALSQTMDEFKGHRLCEDLFDAYCQYMDFYAKEVFKYAFLNGVYIGVLSKESQNKKIKYIIEEVE